MRLIAHGIDLIECDRIAAVWRRHPDRFLQRILTDQERAVITRLRDPVPHVAGRFAAKEAILKVLGTGWRGPVSWTDINITNDSSGAPRVSLDGACARVAKQRGISDVLLSITHTRIHAAASAIAWGP